MKAMVLTQLILTAAIARAADIPGAAAATALYAETRATTSYTTFVGPIPVNGLSITLPAASTAHNAALVTLNMPNLTLSAPTSTTSSMSATLEIVAPFSPKGVLIADGGIGCDSPKVVTSGKKPISITLLVPLGTATQPVEAEWFSETGT